jgi:hypothetical protein
MAQAFDALPDPARQTLLLVRDLIFTTAIDLEDVGEIYETLKWGQPSYVPARPRTGSPT